MVGRGGYFGNQYGKLAKRLITIEAVAKLEGVTYASLYRRLERKNISLEQHISEIIKKYRKDFELIATLSACSVKRKDRIKTIEQIVWDVLVEIYEQNPELKSKRGKYNQLKDK